jgi:hypothetical protein
MNQKLKKKDLDRTGDVGIEDSVVIAIHSHKRDGVCRSYFGVRICAEEVLEIVNFATQLGTAQSMLNELYSVHCQLRSC